MGRKERERQENGRKLREGDRAPGEEAAPQLASGSTKPVVGGVGQRAYCLSAQLRVICQRARRFIECAACRVVSRQSRSERPGRRRVGGAASKRDPSELAACARAASRLQNSCAQVHLIAPEARVANTVTRLCDHLNEGSQAGSFLAGVLSAADHQIPPGLRGLAGGRRAV